METKEFELDQKDRLALLIRKLPENKKGVILVFEGSGIPGIQALVSKLATILDPRHFRLYHMFEDINYNAKLPFLFEFWKILPQMGDVVIIDRSYYYNLAMGMVEGKFKKKDVAKYQHQISDFETTLMDNGYLIYKFYFNLPEKKLKASFKKEKKASWVLPKFLEKKYTVRLKNYKKFKKIFNLLREPFKVRDRITIPWKVFNSENKKEIRGQAIQHLIDTLEKDLNVDSISEVKEFDKAMDHVRSLTKEAG